MDSEKLYKKRTEIKIDKYLFEVSSKENKLSEIEFYGEISFKTLTQIISIKDIDNPSKLEQQMINFHLTDEKEITNKPKDYANLMHKQLVERITYSPWRYLRKIKRKIKK